MLLDLWPALAGPTRERRTGRAALELAAAGPATVRETTPPPRPVLITPLLEPRARRTGRVTLELAAAGAGRTGLAAAVVTRQADDDELLLLLT